MRLEQQIFVQRRAFLLVGIVLCELILVAGHMIFTWPATGTYQASTVDLFHLDRERNLPTLFSSAQFLLLAGVLVSILRLQIRQGISKGKACLWILLAAGAAYLSLDEFLQIHESLGTMLAKAGRAAPDGSLLSTALEFPTYYWALVYLPLALPAALITAVFLWRELGPQRWYPFISISVFLLGAVGLDLLEGYIGNRDHTGIPIILFGSPRLIDTFLIEEFLEMVGVTIVLAGCLSLWVRLAGHEASAAP
jgi:hypothetical protein